MDEIEDEKPEPPSEPKTNDDAAEDADVPEGTGPGTCGEGYWWSMVDKKCKKEETTTSGYPPCSDVNTGQRCGGGGIATEDGINSPNAKKAKEDQEAYDAEQARKKRVADGKVCRAHANAQVADYSDWWAAAQQAVGGNTSRQQAWSQAYKWCMRGKGHNIPD